MLNLEGLVQTKKIEINGKQINIPKISLYHYNLVKDESELQDIAYKIAHSVHKGLSKAEKDIVLLHLLEYNGKLKDTVIKNGITYSLSDVKVIQKLKFNYKDYEFRFKTPSIDDAFILPHEILNKCCISVKHKGQPVSVDFSEMPAFVYKWLEYIVTTIGIESDGNIIKGIDEIVELFDG